jgi:hypothetical protein
MIFGMIDLETLDVLPSAQVLTIGGVKFNPFTQDAIHSEFYYRLDIDEQEQLGRTVSQSTLDDFWARQPAEVIQEAFSPDDRVSCRLMLQSLKKWCVGCDEIWSHGSFDINILENMCRQLGEPIPWAFWQISDSRTFFKRMPEDPRKSQNFTAHNALADAKAQAIGLRKTFKHFGMTK